MIVLGDYINIIKLDTILAVTITGCLSLFVLSIQ